MTFTSNIPAAGDSLGGSRAQIVDNFSNYKANWETNHGLVNDADSGKHLFMQMPEQAAAPTTAANEGALYTKVGTSPAETAVFFRGESNGFEYQITKAVAASTATFGNNTAYAANHTGGWTFLPGGLILQYGIRSSLTASGNTVVTFPMVFPTAVFSVSVTPVRDSNNVNTVYIRSSATITTTQFEIRNTSTGITIAHWYAIGN